MSNRSSSSYRVLPRCCGKAPKDQPRNNFLICLTGLAQLAAAVEDEMPNFGEATLKAGLHRVVNNLPPSASPRLRVNQLPGQSL
jgi:hypothetical protein